MQSVHPTHTRKQRRRLAMKYCVALSLCSIFIGRAAVADHGVYLGLSLGQADAAISADTSLPKFSGTDTAYKIIAGLRPLDWFGIEANYVDLGKPDSNALDAVADSKGVSAFAVGFVDIGPVDLFAKGGAVNWDAAISQHGIRTNKKDGNDFAYGAGVQLHLLLLNVRAEYERFEIEDGVNLLSLGVVWTFL